MQVLLNENMVQQQLIKYKGVLIRYALLIQLKSWYSSVSVGVIRYKVSEKVSTLWIWPNHTG